jgi:dephospho-CoA kinase
MTASKLTGKIGRPKTYNELIRDRVRELRLEGNTWAAIAERLGMTQYQIEGIASRDKLRNLIENPAHMRTRLPSLHPIPRGVKTLPPLPSLQQPLYIMKRDADK